MMSSQESPEANIPMQVIPDGPDLYPRQHNAGSWVVLSLAGDEPTAYRVDTWELTCECRDKKFNREEGEICKHLAKALYVAREKMKTGDLVVKEQLRALERTQSVLKSLEWLNDDLAGGKQAPRENGTQAETAESDYDAETQAENLQEAFDDVIDDMQVTAAAGKVWFQTGRDTPDDWPYPGGSDTFEVITGPDVVEYVHDGSADWADGPHEWFDDKPGEWWKNAMRPADVPDYIAQVMG